MINKVFDFEIILSGVSIPNSNIHPISIFLVHLFTLLSTLLNHYKWKLIEILYIYVDLTVF